MVEKECLPRKKKYEKAKRICGKENKFVVGYDIFANHGDIRTLKPHLKYRRISRNDRMQRLRRKAKRTLEDERFIELRKQRSVEVETVFGQIKGNQGYRRFLLRGMSKVYTEWGLLTLGYNFKQIYRLNRDKLA